MDATLLPERSRAHLFWRITYAREASWHWREARERAVVPRAVLSLPDSWWIEITGCFQFPAVNLEHNRKITMDPTRLDLSEMAKGAAMRVLSHGAKTTGTRLLPKCKGWGRWNWLWHRQSHYTTSVIFGERRYVRLLYILRNGGKGYLSEDLSEK